MMNIEIEHTKLTGLYHISIPRLVDDRGELARTFDAQFFAATGIDSTWQQGNLSTTDKMGTLRGLHYQQEPHEESKLVTPVSGEMYWVSVDVRSNSDTFGHWHALTLSPDREIALYASAGFAHGCLSLRDHTVLSILSTEPHVASLGTGIHWDDPELAIDWPLCTQTPIVSKMHSSYLYFADFKTQINSFGGSKYD